MTHRELKLIISQNYDTDVIKSPVYSVLDVWGTFVHMWTDGLIEIDIKNDISCNIFGFNNALQKMILK